MKKAFLIFSCLLLTIAISTSQLTAADKKAPVAKKAPAVKKKFAPKSQPPTISPRERYEMIATMAYYRAEQRNFAPGNDQDDWYECEQIVDEMLKNRT